MDWELQSLLWEFVPQEQSVSFTLRLFGLALVSCAVVLVAGCLLRKRWLIRLPILGAVLTLLAWGVLFGLRPTWLRVASQPSVPIPTASTLTWQQRAKGLETAELTLRVQGEVVDRMVLVRLDPHQYALSVHWDPEGKHTAEEWQQALGAAVVVNGSYFSPRFVPLTPLRTSGHSAGPADYQSSHGALVVDGNKVDIIDLQQRDVAKSIARFPNAMVSYPLLVSPTSENRAIESSDWLASRNFVAIDVDGKVVLGTTQTGFFTLHRLGEFLKQGPLHLRVALNLDGGALVSQIVEAGDFSRRFHGTAEITDHSDIIRGVWHTIFENHWTLPIVLVATPITLSKPLAGSVDD